MKKNDVLEMLKDEISELILVAEQKGVQPSEIISLCVEDQYKEYRLSKTTTSICFDITCLEEDTHKEFFMRYIYSKDMYLQRIEEVTHCENIVQWDRVDRIECLKASMLFWSQLIFSSEKLAEFKHILSDFNYKQKDEIQKFAENEHLMVAA